MPTPEVKKSADSVTAPPSRVTKKRQFSYQLRGAPVDSTPQVVTQPDGSTLTVTMHGDAARTWATSNGGTVVKDAEGYWRYAKGLDAKGQPVAGATKAGPKTAPPASARDLAPSQDSGGRPAPTQKMPAAGFTGTQRTVVILAQFLDRPSLGTTPAQWNSAFFGASGSVRSYYSTASYGKLTYAPAVETSGTANDGVIGWVTLPMNHPNYAKKFDNGAAEVTKAAINAASPFIDFAVYDTNADGALAPSELHVVVVAAGYEASIFNACAPNLWAHRSEGTDVAVRTDGVWVGWLGYTQFGEAHCRATDPGAATMATIGVITHELGHDMGWPDLYDYSDSTEGLGKWSLMAAGMWGTYRGQIGNAPALPDAWSKYVQGWIEPGWTGANQVVSLPQAASASSQFGVYGVGYGTGEYFLVENRQPIGQDVSVPGCGLIVYHVDERFSDNVPTPTGRLIDIEEGDGRSSLDSGSQGDRGNAWFGDVGHTEFNAYTTPNSQFNDGTPSGAAMAATGKCAPTMQATLGRGGPVPITRPANDNFAAAQVLSPASSGVVNGSTVNATAQTGEPVHVGSTDGPSVWYSWTAPASGTLTLTTTGSGFDTLLAVYTGSSVNALTEVAANDDESTSVTTSRVSNVRVAAGATYRIAVTGAHNATGAVKLIWVHSTGASLANDNFTAPTLLSGRSGALTQTTVTATRETGEPYHANTYGGASVWFSWTAPTSGTLFLTTSGSSFDTMLAVYRGTSVRSLSQVAANDEENSSTSTSRLDAVPVIAGQNYRIAVDGYRAVTGALRLEWYFTPSSAPAFVPLAPTRVLDTRAGIGAPKTKVPAAGKVDLQVTGIGGVPAGATTVVLNVTAVSPEGWGYVTVWPAGAARPTASNLNYVAGQTIPNLVVAKIGSNGKVSLYSSARSELIADVAGYYPAGAAYTGITPVRLLDTRAGVTPVRVPAGGAVTVTVAGLNGVPATASAAMLNITAVNAGSAGAVTAYPAGLSDADATSVSFRAGQTIAGFGIVELGVRGAVTLRSTAATDLIVDLGGWVPQVADTVAFTPTRLITAASIASGGSYQVKVAGVAGIPANAKAVQITLTAVDPPQGGYLTAYPSGQGRPVVSNVNFTPGGSISNSAIVKVGAGGYITVYASNATSVTIDTSAHFTS